MHVDQQTEPAQLPEEVGSDRVRLLRVREGRPGAVEDLVQDQLHDLFVDEKVGVLFFIMTS